MRELKFRAWDFESMRYDVTGFEHGQDNEMTGVFLDGNYYPISSNPVMQYTGLKDKNGKEIYEGDIIKIIGWNYSGYVTFENCEFITKNNNEKAYALSPKHGEDLEVIGNIYENPELLK